MAFKRVKFFWRLFLTLICLAMLFGIFFGFLKHHQHSFERKIYLSSRQLVTNYVKFRISPEPVQFSKPIRFVIEAESYQNTDMLAMDFKEIFYLKDNLGNIYMPYKWIVKSTQSNNVRGDLFFHQINHNVEDFSLILVQLDTDVTFNWVLKP